MNSVLRMYEQYRMYMYEQYRMYEQCMNSTHEQ